MGKRGPWSVEDKNFIAKNFSIMSYKKIGELLDRDQAMVKKFIQKNYAGKFIGTPDAEYNVKKSIMWKTLKEQFSTSELEMFMFHYTNIVAQFRNDIFPTEELQIIDACKLQVLMDRALSQQQRCMDTIKTLEREQDEAKKTNNFESIHSIERQIAALRASQESMNKDHKDMLDQKTKIFREMKATRDQRLKVVEQGKTNFMDWIKRIIQDKDLRIELGQEMEKLRLAADYSCQNLSEYYTFGDTDIDRPILNEISVEKDND